MAVQVVHVATPAAGHDWSYVIPGQYVATLIGVTATLSTGTPVTSIPDETGNGNTATVNAGFKGAAGVAGPYGGGLQNYAVRPDGTSGATYYAASAASASQHVTPNGTLELWLKLTSFGPHALDSIVGLHCPAAPSDATGLGQESGNGPGADVGYFVQNAQQSLYLDFQTVNAWHHVAYTWDGTNVRFYVDGTNTQTLAGHQPVFASGTAQVIMGGSDFGSAPALGSYGAVSVYGVALAGANIAAHAAASSSWTAYRAAVLADTPVALWGLNTIAQGPSRTVVLDVTNGTSIVAAIPATNPATTQPSFTYSWQVLGPGAAQSVDGTTISVPIPAVTLPPGYVVSSSTLDLAGTDQWSNITLWYDDGTGTPSTGGQEPPYLDALLVPTSWTGGT